MNTCCMSFYEFIFLAIIWIWSLFGFINFFASTCRVQPPFETLKEWLFVIACGPLMLFIYCIAGIILYCIQIKHKLSLLENVKSNKLANSKKIAKPNEIGTCKIGSGINYI